MNHETELKIQAWVDGSLPAAEVRSVQDLVSQNPEAKALADEIRYACEALAVGEVARSVPDTREFYWSRIQQRIQAEETSPASPEPSSWIQRWMKVLAPAAILAALTIMLVSPGLFGLRRGFVGLGEFENPSSDTTAFTFRSESEGMTVVWLSTPAE